MHADKIGLLVHILEGIAKVAPQHSAIVGWAHRELEAINAEMAEEARAEAEAKAKADEEEAAHARAVAAAEQKEQEDANEAAKPVEAIDPVEPSDEPRRI